jgi:8-oxo-dGTP pyrophosphatase MutT (NUDIX family)
MVTGHIDAGESALETANRELQEESKLLNPDGEDSIVSVKKIKMGRVRDMLISGELSWSLSTLGLFKVLDFYKI